MRLSSAQIFRRFHAAFIDAISNPFYTVNMVSLHLSAQRFVVHQLRQQPCQRK